MSLRDQLLQKGLVSDKKAREVDRELKRARRERQGHRDSRQEIQARERSLREAEEAARAEALRARRAALDAEREAAERDLRIRNLILGNRVRLARGPVHFHHRTLEDDPAGTSGSRPRLIRLEVNAALARRLQCGEVAIAACRWGSEVTYEAIARQGALRLREIAPELLVHHVDPATAAREPADLAFSPRDWETTLGPRRVTRGT